MPEDLLKIDVVSWQQGQSLLAAIRYSVFVQEQKVPEEEEWDEADQTAVHFVAIQQNDEQVEPVGCARLLSSGKVGRMAVLKEHRNQGIGSALLSRVIQFAREHEYDELFLDAQLHAVSFYERFGFKVEGAEFQDAGIPHRRMRLVSSKEEDGISRLQGGTESLSALCGIMSNARYSIDILTERLDPALYGTADVARLTSALARRGSRSRVRILVKDTRPLRGRSHALIQLVQRLPSRMELRGLREIPQDPRMGYCIVDQQKMVYFSQESELTGFRNNNARAETQNLLEEFNHLWEHYSFNDPNLKKLHL